MENLIPHGLNTAERGDLRKIPHLRVSIRGERALCGIEFMVEHCSHLQARDSERSFRLIWEAAEV